jgi:toxin ParE1/3/4
MNGFRLTHLAKRDLREIFTYVSENSGDARARGLIRDIVAEFPGIGDLPDKGTRRDEFSRGLYSIRVHSYLIFYRRYLGGARIVRVVHGSRNLDLLFEPPRRS